MDSEPMSTYSVSPGRAEAQKTPGPELSGQVLSGRKLHGQQWRNATLRGTRLVETDLTGSDLSNAHLESADMQGAVLEGVILEDASLLGVKLPQVYAVRSAWSGAYLVRSEMSHANCERSQWIESKLRGSRFVRVNWGDADMRRAVVEECELQEPMMGSTLASAIQISNTRIRGGQLVNLRANRARLANVTFHVVDGERSDWSASQIEYCQFYNCTFIGANFRQAVFRSASFRDCNLSGSKFQGVIVETLDLRGCNLRGAVGFQAEHLLRAATDHATTLPNGSRGPYLRFSGAERV